MFLGYFELKLWGVVTRILAYTGIGGVDEKMKNTVQNNIKSTSGILNEKNQQINNQSNDLKGKIDEKVKGQVIGSTLPHGN